MRALLPAVFLLTTLCTVAQPYGNEWIDYGPGRKYLKIQTHEDGLYRINYSTLQFALQSVSEDLTAIDPRSFQIFNRGEEIYLHVEGEADGVFNTTDHIEFYGERNTGWLDGEFYPSAGQHTHPYYSLVSDTNAYFLTWKTDGTFSAKRYAEIPFGTPAPSPLPYVWEEQVKNFANTYNAGPLIGGDKGHTEYLGGEGWTSGWYGYPVTAGGSGRRSQNFTGLKPYTASGAPDAVFEAALSGFNTGAGLGQQQAHHTRLQLGSGASAVTIKDVVYGTYEYVRPTASVSPSQLSATTTFSVSSASDGSLVNAATDRSVCAYMKLKYPRTLDLGGKSSFLFKVPATSGPAFFSASNFSLSPTSVLYDLEKHQRLEVVHSTSAGTVKTNVSGGAERWMFISAESAVNHIGTADLLPVNGTGAFRDFMSLQADSAYIIITHKKLYGAALAYRSHRMQQFNVVLVDERELYDQFSYGINKHPLAIRHFAELAIDQWTSPPSHLFLLGKAVADQAYRKAGSSISAQNLVPTMAYPPSDAFLTSGINGNGLKPAVPTGRLPATTPQEVQEYLAKVQQYEFAQRTDPLSYTLGNRLWQKQMLHFAGGSNKTENDRFKDYLKSFGRYIENDAYAGKVFTFGKTTTNVIEEFNSDSAQLLIQNGVSMMVFFGHGSGNNFDLAVDDPSLWDNRGKYPLIIANSCYSGNIHKAAAAIKSTSEDFVLIPNEGAIGFIATPELSFETGLSAYTLELHRRLGSEEYGHSIGELMLHTAQQLISGNKVNNTVALEMTLNGDPALRINTHEKTEMTINDPAEGPAISFEPQILTSDLDSFDVVIDLTNLGRRTDSAFFVRLERRFPEGETEEYFREMEGLGFQEQVRFTLAVDEEKGIGENVFNVEADYTSLPVVDEFIKSPNNHIYNFEKRITSNDLFPIHPYDFSVVPKLDITLMASTGDVFAEESTYRIQIDTTDLFNSPVLDTVRITQSGGVVKWTPNLSAFSGRDSTVFFWRTSPADTIKWRGFSFQYISGKEGWAQDHFFQYKNNSFDLLDYKRQQRIFAFLPTYRELFVNNIGNPNIGDQTILQAIGFNLDGLRTPYGDVGVCPGYPSMAIAVIDSNDLMPWGTYYNDNGTIYNPDHDFGNNNSNGNCGRSRVDYFFTFSLSDPAKMDAMVEMVSNKVEDGHYIIAYTQVRGLFQDTSIWKAEHIAAFEALGADSIRYVSNDVPYIFVVKKGDPSSAQEVIGTSATDQVSLTRKLFTTIRFGEMASEKIGPAREWEAIHWKQRSMEAGNTEETARVEVKGIRPDGSETVLFGMGKDTLEYDLGDVSAKEFPYLRLNYYTRDNAEETPAQLSNWHVIYTPVPEAALNAAFKYHFQKEALQAGEQLRFAIAIENVSNQDFDSLRVSYSIQPAGSDPILIAYPKQAPLKAGQVLFDTVFVDTRPLSGNYTLKVDVNPEDAFWQPEQFHFNNIAYRTFKVTNDNLNPLLDVTFDGIHILDGDIVSPNPMIVMELKDENKFLLLEDTAAFDVFLTDANGVEKRVPFMREGKEVMQFFPANGKKNKARVEYRPDPLSDGIYRLRVAARDASENAAGKSDFTISFEVINKSTITEVMNYPNPFSTATRFVFTLTGSKIPDVFTIQILTVTGKVVREITRNELGIVRIGRNVTDYAWDGRDEYGDKLAKGIYLYRVITKINGESIEHRESGADTYFHKGFGKMYLF